MFRATRWLLILSLLAAGGCGDVGQWFAGVDTERYSWEGAPGAAVPRLDRDLARCLGDGPKSAAGAGIDIARSDASPVVEACMVQKGYRKVYQSRFTML